MDYILTIPHPCSENWDHMPTTPKGSFCQKCDKEVIDFSDLGIVGLSKKLAGNKSICGRFAPAQLNRRIPSPSRNVWKKNAAILGFTSVLAVSNGAMAQQENPNIERILQHQMPICGLLPNTVVPKDSILIQGHIMDQETPMPGANVVLKGTTIGTQADFDGNFTLTVPDTSALLGDTLVFSYIGYKSLEIPITPKKPFITAIFTDEDVMLMGELVVVRKRNIFGRIGNWLRGR